MFVKRSIIAAALLLIGTVTAYADSVTLSATGQNFLEISFTLPAQTSQHNALSIFVTSSTGPSLPVFGGTASLYNGNSLLSSSQTTSVGQRYASAGSANAATDPVIDYSSIASGSIAGLFTLLVTSGSVTFDTNNLMVQPFGDSGSFPGYAGTVTGVSVSAVPLPAAALLLFSGLGGLGFAARRRESPLHPGK